MKPIFSRICSLKSTKTVARRNNWWVSSSLGTFYITILITLVKRAPKSSKFDHFRQFLIILVLTQWSCWGSPILRNPICFCLLWSVVWYVLAKCKRRTGSFGTSVKANRTLRLLDLAEHALQTFRTCRDVWFTAVDNVLANSYKLIQIQNHIGEGVSKRRRQPLKLI